MQKCYKLKTRSLQLKKETIMIRSTRLSVINLNSSLYKLSTFVYHLENGYLNLIIDCQLIKITKFIEEKIFVN